MVVALQRHEAVRGVYVKTEQCNDKAPGNCELIIHQLFIAHQPEYKRVLIRLS